MLKTLCLYLFAPALLLGFFLQNFPKEVEFYPLSCWGMYDKIYREGPFSKFVLLYKINGEDKDLYWEIGYRNYILRDILRTRVFGVDLGRYSDKAKSPLTIEQFYDTYIVPLLKERSLDVKGAEVEILQYQWQNLTRNNISTPDKKTLLLSRVIK